METKTIPIAKKRRERVLMSFRDYQQTRRFIPDCNADPEHSEWAADQGPTAGHPQPLLAYDHGVIQVVTRHWPVAVLTSGGMYNLLISNHEHTTDDLEQLELELYKWGSDSHLSDWTADYPNLQLKDMGGNTQAWYHPMDNGGYILISDGEGYPEPDEHDGKWLVGRYRAEGDLDGDVRIRHHPEEVKHLVEVFLGW